MNVILIMTDTQCKSMVGCYGHPEFDTPNLDRLASQGIRFERAYTGSPVCTPARGTLFTGLAPQCNGAWANQMSCHRSVPMMGEVFQAAGIRAGYTGKWHLDGTTYEGTGVPGGGFEPDWWCDMKNVKDSLPPEIAALYSMSATADDLRAAGLQEEHVYGHIVTDRAVDFLENVGDEPFSLVVSYDEPHDPWICPPEWWEKFQPGDLPKRPNYLASVADKPQMQQVHAAGIKRDHGTLSWDELVAKRLKFFGCNSYIDREIGRVIDAVDRLHADDTLIVYTSDHGDMLGSHWHHDKGAFMYEEVTNIPFIVRVPSGPQGAVSQALVSHMDLMPTFADYAGITWPKPLPGKSLRPVLEAPDTTVHDHVSVSFNRFNAGSDSARRAEFYPIRCVADSSWKLVINLLDTDELYNMQDDPYEMTNLINEPDLDDVRARLHDLLLADLAAWEDPMNSWAWGSRPWRSVREMKYH